MAERLAAGVISPHPKRVSIPPHSTNLPRALPDGGSSWRGTFDASKNYRDRASKSGSRAAAKRKHNTPCGRGNMGDKGRVAQLVEQARGV